MCLCCLNVKSFTAQTDLYCFVTYLLCCDNKKPFTIYIKKETKIRIDRSMILFLSVTQVLWCGDMQHVFPHLKRWCVLLKLIVQMHWVIYCSKVLSVRPIFQLATFLWNISVTMHNLLQKATMLNRKLVILTVIRIISSLEDPIFVQFERFPSSLVFQNLYSADSDGIVTVSLTNSSRNCGTGRSRRVYVISFDYVKTEWGRLPSHLTFSR